MFVFKNLFYHDLIILFRLAHLFDMAEESFLRVTEQVIDALLEKIQQFIYWPSENELPLYGNQFDGIGR